MEEQDQYWTQWKGSDRQSKRTLSVDFLASEGEIKPLPEKPQTVADFELMNKKEKERVRDSEEWPEIAEYYNKVWEIIQDNHAVYYYRMKTYQMAVGTVPYLHGLQVTVCHKPTFEGEQWAKEPGKDRWHKPGCGFRLGGWKERFRCKCFPRRAYIK